MKIILLSGGSGRRLWPISNDSRTKQFIPLLLNDCGELESMIQRVWRQLESLDLRDSTFISTSKQQVEILQKQLGQNISLIIEPERRDTFPAIALACAYLFSIVGIRPDEVICVLPVDLFVDDKFFGKIIELESIVSESNCDLALIGVEPRYPAQSYGYIVPNSQIDEESNISKYTSVNHFVEKPNEEVAQDLILQGALWNCGVFAFKLGHLLSILKERGFPTAYEGLLSQYDQLPKKSFDYELVEGLKSILVSPYFGRWSDLGTWNTLTEELNSRIIGEGIISENCNDVYVINELNIPVIVNGLSDVVVGLSEEGLIVTSKADSDKVKSLIDKVCKRKGKP